MRAAFIPALPPSALLAGMIAPSFRLVNRFCGKKLLRTYGRRERPPALCPLWAWSPLACGRVPYPPYARYGMGRLCGERRRRERCERLKGARNASPRTLWRPMPGHAPPHRPAKAPPCASASAAVDASPRPPLAPWVRASPPPLRASVSSAHLGVEGSGATRRKRPPQADFFDARSARV